MARVLAGRVGPALSGHAKQIHFLDCLVGACRLTKACRQRISIAEVFFGWNGRVLLRWLGREISERLRFELLAFEGAY